mmetsp:Transcript_1159/g.719  ORF Transcript_1159/g.719 Transcript_1159/m.719 type:complete len:87 (-) Transcript_1159:478-738(-)
MIAGGFERCVDSCLDFGIMHLGIHGRNLKQPDFSLRAFDKDATGTICGDGGGFIVFESLESAQRRGAPIIAEVIGEYCFYSGNSVL